MTDKKMTNLQHIVKGVIDKKPSQIKTYVGKEISARVMDHINVKRTEVGKTMFNR